MLSSLLAPATHPAALLTSSSVARDLLLACTQYPELRRSTVVVCRCPSRLPAPTAHLQPLLHCTGAPAVPVHCYLRLSASVPPIRGPPRYPVRATAVLPWTRDLVPPTLLGLCSVLDLAGAAR
ncbi:hypothetical protein K438DRAFT_1966827 [Mycena galopus ATCC 62051]|nr:hypothetical protein K438DRAFT_1966827 [Mycena galopus ATCC 62051]